MRVASDKEVAGESESLFDCDLMADAAADIVKVFDSLLSHEFSDCLMVLSRLFVCGGNDMVKNDQKLIGVVDLYSAHLFEGGIDRRRVVVSQNIVRF